MEESTCNEMIIHLSQRFSSMLCIFIFCEFKYDFHVDADKREKCKEIYASMV